MVGASFNAGAGAGASSGSGVERAGAASRKMNTRLVIAGGRRGNIAYILNRRSPRSGLYVAAM